MPSRSACSSATRANSVKGAAILAFARDRWQIALGLALHPSLATVVLALSAFSPPSMYNFFGAQCAPINTSNRIFNSSFLIATAEVFPYIAIILFLLCKLSK